MANRTSEATTLNTTLGTLVTDIAAYLAAGGGDHFNARQAVFTALRNRLVSNLGPIEFDEHTSTATTVPGIVTGTGDS